MSRPAAAACTHRHVDLDFSDGAPLLVLPGLSSESHRGLALLGANFEKTA